MSSTLFKALVLVFFFISSTYADTSTPNEIQHDHSKLEPWYVLTGPGLNTDFSRNQLKVHQYHDLLGFFWRLNESERSMFGGVISYSATNSEKRANELTISGSYVHFLQSPIGEGWFFRGDAGFGSKAEEVIFNFKSGTSLSVRAGGGYGWPISSETRLLVNLAMRASFHRSQTSVMGLSGVSLLF